MVIQKALSADHEVRVAETNRRGHATRLARGGANDGTDVVVVLGGDGTLNEAANGLAGTETALAPLPGGSTNVFARTMGLPDDPVEATALLLGALDGDHVAPVGLGSVNGRYFLFHVGMGFDAAVVQQVERRGTMKRWASHPLFAYSAVTTWLRHYDRSRPRLAVRHQDGTVIDDSYFSVVFNTNPYTYVGARPFNLAPDATLDRGLVSLSVRTLRPLPFAGLIGSALFSGAHLRSSRHTDYRTDLASLTVTGHGPVPYQVDGDYLGDTERLEFRHHPGILRLVRPV